MSRIGERAVVWVPAPGIDVERTDRRIQLTLFHTLCQFLFLFREWEKRGFLDLKLHFPLQDRVPIQLNHFCLRRLQGLGHMIDI